MKNAESEFVSWARRTENVVSGIHPGARDVLTWAVECRRLEKTETILRMLEDSDNGKGEVFPKKERERIPLALAKEREQEKMEKMMRNHQDERTHQKFKVSVGTAGKQVISLRTAGQTLADGQQQSQGQSNSPGKGNDVKGKSGKGGRKKGKSKDAGAREWNQQRSPVASSVGQTTVECWRTLQTKDTRFGWTETLATSSKRISPILTAMRTCFHKSLRATFVERSH